MLEEVAKVVKSEGQQLWVEALSRNACSQCATNHCTTSVIAKLFGMRPNRLQLENTLGAKTGDEVVIGIPDALLVRASLWSYLLPLTVMLLLPLLGSAMGAGDGVQVLLALLGLLGGLYLVRLAHNHSRAQQLFKPRLKRILTGQTRTVLSIDQIE